MGDIPAHGSPKAARRTGRKFVAIGVAAVAATLLAGGIWMASKPPVSAVAVGTFTAKAGSSQAAPTVGPAAPASGNANHTTNASSPASTTSPKPLTKAEASAKAKTEKALAAIPQPVAPSVALTAVSKAQAGITVSVDRVEAVQGKGQGPGQISGPAVRFTVKLGNASSDAIDTSLAVVNVDAGHGHVPAILLSGPGAVAFPASVGPGQSATGTYVFLIPNDQRDQVRIFFNYKVSSSIVAFEGAVPKTKG